VDVLAVIFLEIMQSLVRYDPATGRLYRLGFPKKPTAPKSLGLIPIALNHGGYPYLTVGGERWLAHRLAWFLMTGERRNPALPLDHADGDRSNNRWSNLRAATPALNTQNRGLSKHNTSGTAGVCWCKQTSKWKARINVGGRQVQLGLYANLEDATAARRAGELAHFAPGFVGSERPAFQGVSR
jgi:hypothetical protein